MRRTFIWIGVAGLVIAYLAWTVTHTSDVPSNAPIIPTSASSPTTTTAPSAKAPAVTPLSTASPSPVPNNAKPTLLLNAGRVTHQSVVSTSGFGFAPGEKLQIVHDDPPKKPVSLVTTRADKNGDFNGATFRIADSWASGLQTVEVIGASSNRRAKAQFLVEGGQPGAQPTTYSGKPMSSVSFSGGGFQAHEEVTVYFDSLDSTALAHLKANAEGIVHVSGVQVPPSSPGQHAFLLVGQSSQAPVRVPFSVLGFNPWLGLSTYTPQPENPVGITGHDFAPGERVAIFLDSPHGVPIATSVVDKTGVFHASPAFVVPYDRRGKMKIYAVGSVSQVEVNATLTVLPYTPTFALTSYAGPPGSTVGLTGQGFAHDETLSIHLGLGSQSQVIVRQTDAKGQIAPGEPIHIPDHAAAGKLAITVVGNHSQAPAEVTYAVLPLDPWIASVPAAGPSGIHIAFTGGGFEPGEQVQISVASSDHSTASAPIALTADSQGTIRRGGSLLIPTNLTGKVGIQAIGTRSGAKATATYEVIGAPVVHP